MGCTYSNTQPTILTNKRRRSLDVYSMDLVGERSGNIFDDYEIISPAIGVGAYGEVKKAIHKLTGIRRAVKIIKKPPDVEEQKILRHEVDILKRLDHINIIKVLEFYQDPKFFYIITELCRGKPLFEKIDQAQYFTERMAAETIKQILSAVAYCHANKIVHRDIKPENLIYESHKEEPILKLVDFGTSKSFANNKKLSQKLGTITYMAPEVFTGKYDAKCDIWSCGVILYKMLSGGIAPFTGKDEHELIENITKGKFNMNDYEWTKISESAKHLLKRMLDVKPSHRVSAAEALKHPWIEYGSKKEDVNLKATKKTLNNLINFKMDKELQEAIWIFIVSYLITDKEKNEYQEAFQELDSKGDGLLSKEELIEGFKKIMGEDEAEQETESLFEKLDKNRSGFLEYSEFLIGALSSSQMLTKSRLKAAFQIIDKDSSGQISIDDLKTIFAPCSKHITDEDWKKLIAEFDTNKDGQISYEDFELMMKPYIKNEDDNQKYYL